MLTERLNQLKDSEIMLFNANAQTLLHSLKDGAAGYSGVMANFHPELYSWLCDNINDEKAEFVQGYLGYASFTECMAYPVTAKYAFNLRGITMEIDSRSRKKSEFDKYQMLNVKQGIKADKDILDCAKFGNATGARCCMAKGATEGITSYEEIQNFIDKL